MTTASSSPRRDHCIVVPASPTYVERPADLGGAQRLAVFAVDFSRESGRSFVDAAPACARAAELRPRGPAEPSGAGADQQRIAAVLYELRLQPPRPCSPTWRRCGARPTRQAAAAGVAARGRGEPIRAAPACS